MRLNAARSGLCWACLTSPSVTLASTVCNLSGRFFINHINLGQGTAPNQVVVSPGLVSSSSAAELGISDSESSTFQFPASTVDIVNVTLKSYSPANDGIEDVVVAFTEFTSPSAGAGVGSSTNPSNHIAESGPSFGLDILQQVGDSSVNVVWYNYFTTKNPTLPIKLYLECSWENSTASGTSTTPLYAITCDGFNQLPPDSGDVLPARAEAITQRAPSSTTPSSKPSQLSPTASKTSEPAATAGLQTSTARAGLSKGGIIGVAVGVTLGGLIIAGLLVFWFFYLRRRCRARPGRRAMEGYDSGVAGRGKARKEIPVVAAEASPRHPRPRHDTEEEAAQPVVNPFPQYSDNDTTTATPTTPTQIHRLAEDTGPAISQTDLTSTRSVPSAAAVISPRYAHLVEEGMSDEEIRRLEEEEQQLDEEIENAGRRANHEQVSGGGHV